MYEQEKDKILESNISKSTNLDGSRMNVPRRSIRFPPIGGVQQKVTLISNKTGTFMNIGFMKDVENKISGNIADALLDMYPGIFKVVKLNGRLIKDGVVDKNKSDLKEEIMKELREEYEIKPKEAKPTKRSRVEETQISNGQSPSKSKLKNSFSKK